MGKRLLSLLLVVSLMLGLGLPVQAAGSTRTQSVVYIPLDDRPFNNQRVRLMAQSLGMELIMPSEDLYATKLDGQDLNQNGTQSGDRAALLQWLQRMDRKYDTFVISLDQLLSGGLMNSRCMDENQPLDLGGSSMTEYQVIDYLATLAENNTVYLIDSVLRLATSCGYGGYDLEHYTLFRRYGLAARPVLSGADLTADQVIAAYQLGLDDQPAYAALSQKEQEMLLSPLALYRDQGVDPALEEAYLTGEDPAELVPVIGNAEVTISLTLAENTESALAHYLKIRARKLRLTDYALKALSGLSNVHYLLGIDDSSEGNNIQSNELALYAQYLTGENHLISSSLDSLGQMALAKLFLSTHPAASPRVQVTYFGDGADMTPDFNTTPLRDMVDQTLSYLEAEQTSGSPDLSVVVVTACDSQLSRQGELLNLVSRLNENEASQIPTILIDASDNREALLDQLLTENVHLSMLLSYSGQHENPNCTTMALSQGLARYRALLEPGLQTETTQRAHLENLCTALVKEMAYHDSASRTVVQTLKSWGLDPSNFGTQGQSVQTRAEELLTGQVSLAAEGLLENLTGNYISSLAPYTLQRIAGLSIDRCSFPWLRQTEIGLSLSLTLDSSPADPGEFHRAYISGITDSTFEPDGGLTRAQAAKLLVSASQLPVSDGENPFPDTEGWAEEYILAAYQAGLVSGYPDGTYRPDSCISRAEFAQVIFQLTISQNILLEPVTDAVFWDLPREGQWYAEAVYALADAGLMDGYPGDIFLAEDPITRAEAVVVVNRLLHRSETPTSSLRTLGRFTDVPPDWRYDPILDASVSHFCENK